MHRLSVYILRQMFGPLILFSFLIAVVIWLTQSLRLLDLVLNRAQSAATFAYLSVLILPGLLNIIIPLAFFAGCLYALNRLKNDSEMVIMWAAGYSRAQMAMPILLTALLAMSMTYACNLYLAPLCQRVMKERVYDIRADIGTAILKEGTFNTPSENFTVFTREIASSGKLMGVLVHDSTDAKRPVSYIAQSGVFADTENGPRLVLLDGTIEQTDGNGSRLSMLKFDQYILNLDQYADQKRSSELDANEMYLPTLFHPGPLPGKGAQKRVYSYLAEAHGRLSSPLYCIVFGLIALAATCKGRTGRVAHTMRLIAAALSGLALRMIGYSLQGTAEENPALDWVLYAVPLVGALLAIASISDVPAWIRQLVFPAKPDAGWPPAVNEA